MRATFLAEAEAELVVAADRYEAANPGLGMNFRRDVRRIVALILTNKRIGKSITAGRAKDLREFGLDRFPYSVVYRIVPGGVTIVAISHQHRRSDYWRNRVEEPVPTYTIELAA